MTVHEDTITELTETDIKKWAPQPTHASVENTRKELTKRVVTIKTRYDAFRLGRVSGTPQPSCWRRTTDIIRTVHLTIRVNARQIISDGRHHLTR